MATWPDSVVRHDGRRFAACGKRRAAEGRDPTGKTGCMTSSISAASTPLRTCLPLRNRPRHSMGRRSADSSRPLDVVGFVRNCTKCSSSVAPLQAPSASLWQRRRCRCGRFVRPAQTIIDKRKKPARARPVSLPRSRGATRGQSTRDSAASRSTDLDRSCDRGRYRNDPPQPAMDRCGAGPRSGPPERGIARP